MTRRPTRTRDQTRVFPRPSRLPSPAALVPTTPVCAAGSGREQPDHQETSGSAATRCSLMARCMLSRPSFSAQSTPTSSRAFANRYRSVLG